MVIRIIIYIYCIVFFAGAHASAQTASRIKFWLALVDTAPLETVAMNLANQESPTWPVIPSPYAANLLPNGQKQLALDSIHLAEELHEAIAGRFSSSFIPNQVQSETEVKLFGSIANSLNQSGGYCNILLADTALRLAIFRISQWQVFHPEDQPELDKMLSMLNIPVVNVKKLLAELSSQDKNVTEHRDDIWKIKDDASLYKAYESIGMQYAVAIDPQTECTGTLLKQPSVFILMLRMAETEAFVKVQIRGSMRFYQLGGTYAELNPRDIRSFASRMGADAKVYSYSPLRIRGFTENDALANISLQKDSAVKSAWLNIALK